VNFTAVEDLVQQLQQVLAGTPDVVEVLLLAVVEIAEHPLQQHLGEPDDGVERGPQLVRHAGQELRLVPAGHLHLGRPGLEGVDQVDAADGDRRLGGEGGQQLGGPVAERVDLGPPDDQDADDLAVEQHGDAHGGPEAAVALDVEPAVLGVGEDVGDLLGLALQPDPACERAPVLGQRVLVEVGAVLLGEGARGDRRSVRVALEQEDQGDVGPAEVAGAVDDGLQHGVEVRGGAAENGQHPARRRLLLPGLAEVAPGALDLLAPPPEAPTPSTTSTPSRTSPSVRANPPKAPM
jgi:hypothetical protein